jgi:hypothetical protein
MSFVPEIKKNPLNHATLFMEYYLELNAKLNGIKCQTKIVVHKYFLKYFYFTLVHY